MISDRYAVIGNPVAHSKSPEIHAQFAMQTHQHLSYERMLAPLDGFAGSVQTFLREGGRGANVTLPFKLEAYALASALTDRARCAGAVNTLKFDDGGILGDNTDGIGLVRDIVRNAGVELAGSRILLLGAGGAARGALQPLLDQHPERLVIANRNKAKAELLVLGFKARVSLAAADYPGLNTAFDLIVNATSASLANEVPPLPAICFGARSLAYDMMYGAKPTVFMQYAAQHGAALRDGLGMLVEQAAESFFVWRGVRPDTAPVLAQLRAGMQAV